MPIVLKNQTEAEFMGQVIELAKLCGWRVAHFRGVRVQRKNGTTYWQTPVQADGAGFPDLILVRGRKIIAAELKVGTNDLTAAQGDWLYALGSAGVETRIWTPLMWDVIEATLKGEA